jgi:hypothetical protein
LKEELRTGLLAQAMEEVPLSVAWVMEVVMVMVVVVELQTDLPEVEGHLTVVEYGQEKNNIKTISSRSRSRDRDRCINRSRNRNRSRRTASQRS